MLVSFLKCGKRALKKSQESYNCYNVEPVIVLHELCESLLKNIGVVFLMLRKESKNLLKFNELVKPVIVLN